MKTENPDHCPTCEVKPNETCTWEGKPDKTDTHAARVYLNMLGRVLNPKPE